VAAVVLAAIVGVAVALLATGTLGGDDEGGDEPSTTEARTTETVTEERTTETTPETTTETTPPDDGPTDFDYEPFTSEAASFSTVIPSGDGWSEPDVSEPSEGIIRTSIAGPDGLEIIIDHTPGETATFKPPERCKETDHPTVQYSARCEFTGGALEPCQRARCIDDLLNAGVDGPGWAVVVGGGDYADTKAISERVVGAFEPQGVGGP
jgi:hypothetical protein